MRRERHDMSQTDKIYLEPNGRFRVVQEIV
jgi:hypothetical protein